MPKTSNYRGGLKCRNRFGALLLERGITSQQLAEQTGCSVQTIRSWRGMTADGQPRRTPSVTALYRLAQVLGIADTKTKTGAEQVLRLIQAPVE